MIADTSENDAARNGSSGAENGRSASSSGKATNGANCPFRRPAQAAKADAVADIQLLSHRGRDAAVDANGALAIATERLHDRQVEFGADFLKFAVEKADGNPLFVEEIANYWLAQPKAKDNRATRKTRASDCPAVWRTCFWQGWTGWTTSQRRSCGPPRWWVGISPRFLSGKPEKTTNASMRT